VKTTQIFPFRELLESTPDAMVIVNELGIIVLINSRTEKLFGYDREDLLGHSVERLIPARFQDRHLDHRAAYLSDPRTREVRVG
jgi:PAS domain S-box-containing protein